MKGIILTLVGVLSIFTLSAQTKTNLKGQNHLVDGEESYRLYVKISPDIKPDVEQGKVQSYSSKKSAGEGAIRILESFTVHQLVKLTEAQHQEIQSGRSRKSQPTDGIDLTRLSGLIEVDEAPLMNKNEVLALANQLETFPEVEYCEIVPITPVDPPSLQNTEVAPSESWTSNQFYLYGIDGSDSRIVGVYADYAWSLGIYGQGVKVADIEWGMDYDHEEFENQDVVEAIATTNNNYDDHGTAVMGEMIAEPNGYGVTGICYGMDQFRGYSEITRGRPAGIAQAISELSAGDVFVYEMQTGGAQGDYGPADYSQTVWDLTKQATEAGIIIVAAAGNGNENLDAPEYADYRARGDNGSIIVGAGTRVGRNKAGFSTYGDRVNLCGIGDWSIYTTGYGSLYDGGPHSTYTPSFSGTSSSTPIVAGAAVLVQSYAKQELGMTLTPIQMRELLVQTGTPQGTGGNIGPLPNVKAAIERLDELYGASTPEITFTSPTNNQIIELETLSSIQLTSQVTVNDGSITSVEYSVDGQTFSASNQGSNYSANWTPTSYGTFDILATALSSEGKSKEVTITVTVAVPPKNWDLAISSISSLSNEVCGNSFDVSLVVENEGTNTVQTFQIETYSNGALINTSTHNTVLSSGQTTTIQIQDVVVLSEGTNSLEFVVKRPNGNTDQNDLNDSETTAINVQYGTIHTFSIAERSRNTNINWIISQNNIDVIESSSITRVLSGINLNQEFCLANGCYDIIVTDAFSSGACSAETWNSTTEYCAGREVSYNGRLYRSNWCGTGNIPTENNYQWNDLGECAQSYDDDTYSLTKSGESSYFTVQVQNYNNQETHSLCSGPIEFTVTYNPNGGTSGNNTSEIVEENNSPTLNGVSPSRNGYNFLGWNTAANGSGSDFNNSTTITNDITVYAQWEEIIIVPVEYTVTYDANGGTSGNNTSELVEKNNSPTLNDVTPSRNGYNFIGWNTAANGSGSEFNNSTTITNDITVYAQWEEIIIVPVEYTVTYDANGGTSSNNTSEIVEENNSPTLNGVSPSRNGYNFIGWNTAANGSGSEFNNSTTITNDITVYAQWEEIIIVPVEYTVTYDANGGTSGNNTSELVEENNSPTLNDVTPSRNGYNFIGWNTAANGSGSEFNNSATITNDITVYAQWEELNVIPVEITVIIDANGGEFGASGSLTFETGDNFIVNDNDLPTKDGFVFVGWNSQADGQGTPLDNNTIIDADFTAFAQWEAISTGIINNENANIDIYPNPAVSVVHTGLEGQYSISTLTGNTVQQGLCNDIINIQSINKGVYIIQITKGDKTYTSKLFK